MLSFARPRSTICRSDRTRDPVALFEEIVRNANDVPQVAQGGFEVIDPMCCRAFLLNAWSPR